jgi:DNA-binding XRE family transcriptional regulator
MEEKDFLDELVEEGTLRNPEFPKLLEAAERTRALMRALADARERAGLTQAEVAERMGTSQPAVARLERAEADPRLSTVERYAEVVGRRLNLAVAVAAAPG